MINRTMRITEEASESGFRIGLKLFSTDIHLIPDARKIRDLFQFIELYVVPGTYTDTIATWKKVDSAIIIHAPHSHHGVNLAKKENEQINRIHISEAQLFADHLNSDIIIVHGGNRGVFEETVRQLLLLKDERVILENKPKIGIKGSPCVGYSPAEFRCAIKVGAIQSMALDFGHAVCAARSLDVNPIDLITEFMCFHPRVFHLSDGNSLSERDSHLNLGQGTFNLAPFVSLVPQDGFVTLETPRNPENGLNDFLEDVRFLRELMKKTI